MALINHRTREIHFKIVYYGCGLCGKTTNLKVLHDRLPPERRGKMISIATDHERTLFFDFLPIDLGQVNGFLTRFHLYTVPGQVYYRLSRRAVLQGVDGLVFVADSHPAREHANRESLADLQDHLRTIGLTGPLLARIPWVMQYNKRDAAMPIPLERLRASLNPLGWPEFEAVASDAKGVNETLRAACKAVLARLATGTPVPAHAAGAAASGATATIQAHGPVGAALAPHAVAPPAGIPGAPLTARPVPSLPVAAPRPAAPPVRVAQARPPAFVPPPSPALRRPLFPAATPPVLRRPQISAEPPPATPRQPLTAAPPPVPRPADKPLDT